jgi:hypothetical protein
MKVNPWKVSTVLLAGALALVIGSGAVREASAEKQPHMTAALGQLEAALASLQKATADKGGHRVKAMELTRSAISETKAGIDHDNKH